MATEILRSGWFYKEDTATANFSDNRIEINSHVGNMKIVNDDSVATLEFSLNRADDSTEVDGIVLPGEKLEFSHIVRGLSSIAIKGNGAYRVWAYD